MFFPVRLERAWCPCFRTCQSTKLYTSRPGPAIAGHGRARENQWDRFRHRWESERLSWRRLRCSLGRRVSCAGCHRHRSAALCSRQL